MMELSREVELFSEFTEKELARVQEIAESKLFEPGTTILEQGKPVEAIFVLLEGRVRVTAVMAAEDVEVGQDEEVLAQLGPGEFFGELSFVNTERPNLSVIADSQSLVAVLPNQALRELIDSDGPICRKFLTAIMRTMVTRLRTTGKELVLSRYFLRGR